MSKRFKTILSGFALIAAASEAGAGEVHDLKWNFGAFSSVQVINDVQLRYCYNAQKQPANADCGMYVYTAVSDTKYEVKIDTGTFVFEIYDGTASAEFVNTRGQRYTATD